jgi:hypothetical protein
VDQSFPVDATLFRIAGQLAKLQFTFSSKFVSFQAKILTQIKTSLKHHKTVSISGLPRLFTHSQIVKMN